MSAKIITVYWSHYNSGISKTEVRCLLEVDTVSDLPGMDDISGYRLTIGCVANIIDTAAVYKINSAGNWYVQEQGTDFYTKSQIDTMMAAKQDLLTFDDTPTTNSDNPVKSKGIKSYVDTAVSDKITMTNILGAGQRIAATPDAPIDLDSITTVGRYNWLGSSTANMDHLAVSGKGGLLEVSYIQGGSTILHRFWPSDGANSPVSFYARFRYGSQGTWTGWYVYTGTPV